MNTFCLMVMPEIQLLETSAPHTVGLINLNLDIHVHLKVH